MCSITLNPGGSGELVIQHLKYVSVQKFYQNSMPHTDWVSLFSQEGANINKSLTTLGKVISALAEMVRLLLK